MKKVLFTLILMIAFAMGFVKARGQTTLSAGDVVIVSVNGDTDDTYGKGFSFMPLVDLQVGTVIFFTDVGWSDVTNLFITNTSISDNCIRYTAPTAITAGTVIRNSASSTSNFAFEWANNQVNNGSYLSPGGLTQSDEILVYQGTKTSPTFIYAVTYVSTNVAINGWATSVGSNGTDGSGAGSALPPGLSDDVTALSFNQPDTGNDNCSYSDSISPATKAQWQYRVKDVAHWTFNDAKPIPTPPVGPYTVIGPNAAPTDISLSASSVN